MIWTNRHKKIFLELIEVLHKNNIKYFIYRNYSELPNKIPTNDIDIVVDPKSFSRCRGLLTIIFKNNKIEYLKTVNYGTVVGYFGIDLSAQFVIEIDLLCGCVAMGGYEILPFNQIYSYKTLYHGFNVIPKELDALLLLFYKVIGWGKIKSSYIEELRLSLSSTSHTFKYLLSKILNQSEADFIIDSINNSPKDIQKRHLSIAHNFKLRKWIYSPINTFKLVCKYKYHRFLKCKTTQFVCVESPDGTGKTTFISILSNLLDIYFIGSKGNKSHTFHFRPQILPNLGEAGEKAGIMKQDKDFTNPHRKKPVGVISSIFRICYYWIDYLVGMPLILHKDSQYDRITIFDRYIYDFLVDPRRSRISLPYWVRKTFTQLVKQPQIIFILETDTDTIYARKQELSKDEINRQLREFRKLTNISNNTHFLNASQAPEKIAMDAMKIILDTFTAKLTDYEINN